MINFSSVGYSLQRAPVRSLMNSRLAVAGVAALHRSRVTPATSSSSAPLLATLTRRSLTTQTQPGRPHSANDLPVTPKAAMILIGNEILSGKIQDSNLNFLSKELYHRGVDMVRAEVIPDEVEVIVDTIHRLKKVVGDDGVIFTSGGIGPTHDDKTYEAVAQAFGRDLSLHEPTKDIMVEHYAKKNLELNEARLRMATLPEHCTVYRTPGLWVPLICVEGVYVLPGIPRLFQDMMRANFDLFHGPTSVCQSLYIMDGEGDIAQSLGQIAEKYPDVAIGSYPCVDRYVPPTADDKGSNSLLPDSQSGYNTKLVFEGRDEGLVLKAREEMRPFVMLAPEQQE